MDLFTSLPILIVAIVIHEAWGHKLFAETLTSLRPTLIAVGIPIVKNVKEKVVKTFFGKFTIPALSIDTTWKRIEREKGVPIVFSWLLVGGGVGFDDKQHYSVGRLPEKLLMIFAGPLANIAFALWLLLIFSDWQITIEVFVSYSRLTVELIGAIFDPVATDRILSSRHFYEATLLLASKTIWWQVVAYGALWNISLAITNLLPIPGLDGGQIVSMLFINLLGEGVVPIVKKVNLVSAYFLIFVSTISMIWWIASSLFGLILTLG